jgi:hypothetical protein
MDPQISPKSNANVVHDSALQAHAGSVNSFRD